MMDHLHASSSRLLLDAVTAQIAFLFIIISCCPSLCYCFSAVVVSHPERTRPCVLTYFAPYWVDFLSLPRPNCLDCASSQPRRCQADFAPFSSSETLGRHTKSALMSMVHCFCYLAWKRQVQFVLNLHGRRLRLDLLSRKARNESSSYLHYLCCRHRLRSINAKTLGSLTRLEYCQFSAK